MVKKITMVLFVLVLSFFLMKNVDASLIYLSVDNLDKTINEVYTGLVKYEDNYYYLSNGEIIKNDVVTIDNEEYYFNNYSNIDKHVKKLLVFIIYDIIYKGKR